MSRRRRLPPALFEPVLIWLLIAALLGALGVVGVGISVIHARDSRAFERRSVITNGVVQPMQPGMPDDRIPVQYQVGDKTVQGMAPVVDRDPYHAGETHQIRYDPTEPTRVEFLDQPYDLATPLAFAIGLLLIAAVIGAAALARALRLLHLAGSRTTAYSFRGSLANQSRRNRPSRPWVLLGALDAGPGDPPVAAIPLVRGQRLPQLGSFDALVKGTVRDGGTAVVQTDGRTLWPAGRVRVGAVPGLGDDAGR